jgi:hypothetical protein
MHNAYQQFILVVGMVYLMAKKSNGSPEGFRKRKNT